LCVAVNDTEISDQLAFTRRGHPAPGRLDDPTRSLAWRERQWPFEVRISAATVAVKPVPAASTLIRTSPGPGSGTVFRQFRDFGTAEPSNTDMLPRHALTVPVNSAGVMLHVAVALSGRIDLSYWPRSGKSPLLARS